MKKRKINLRKLGNFIYFLIVVVSVFLATFNIVPIYVGYMVLIPLASKTIGGIIIMLYDWIYEEDVEEENSDE